MNHQEPLKKTIINKVFFSDSAHKVIFFQKRKKNRHALQCKQSCRKKKHALEVERPVFQALLPTYVCGKNRGNMTRYNFF